MGINLLFVEDMKLKRDEVYDYLVVLDKTLKLKLRINEASSYQGAVELLDSNIFDKVILDMTIPDSEVVSVGNQLNPFGGEDVLFEINCLETPPAVLVLTMYESFVVDSKTVTIELLSERIRKSFPLLNVRVVFYQTASHDWKIVLKNFLESKE